MNGHGVVFVDGCRPRVQDYGEDGVERFAVDVVQDVLEYLEAVRCVLDGADDLG